MTVRVDHAVSEVTTEPEPTAGTAAGPEPDWAALDRHRALHGCLVRDRLRTRAEEFDD